MATKFTRVEIEPPKCEMVGDDDNLFPGCMMMATRDASSGPVQFSAGDVLIVVEDCDMIRRVVNLSTGTLLDFLDNMDAFRKHLRYFTAGERVVMLDYWNNVAG